MKKGDTCPGECKGAGILTEYGTARVAAAPATAPPLRLLRCSTDHELWIVSE